MGNGNSKLQGKIDDSAGTRTLHEKITPIKDVHNKIDINQKINEIQVSEISLNQKTFDSLQSSDIIYRSNGNHLRHSSTASTLAQLNSIENKSSNHFRHHRHHNHHGDDTQNNANVKVKKKINNTVSQRPVSNRSSSFNTMSDLPPSMAKINPKPPILRYNTTDDTSETNTTNSNLFSDHELSRQTTNHNLSIPSLSKNRSNSFSSFKSGKSSISSSSQYATPLNSPGIIGNNTNNTNTEIDYFNIKSYDTELKDLSGTTMINTPMTEIHIDYNMETKLKNNQSSSHNHHNHHNQLNNSNSNNNNTTEHNNIHTKDNTAGEHYPTTKLNDLSLDDNDNLRTNLDGQPTDTDSKMKKITKSIDIDDAIQKLLDVGYSSKRTKNVRLKTSEITQICYMTREIFLSQPTLLELSPSVKIVGDVHGQFHDLLRLFDKCGFPPKSNYLFLGDYVDRGKQSLETILLLFCYKIKYPENFFLLRGNHECANVTRVYGFYDECKRRCNIKIWKLFIDTFNTLPLAAIVAGKIFCVHGGLSPVLNSMDEIRHVSRPTDVPDFGLVNDLLWSDPTDSPNEWEDNERGVSYCYNKTAINKFLNRFGFDLICRAHMVVEDGYEFFNNRSLVTVFSAPNYCGEFDNWGAVMTVAESLLCSFELLEPLDSAALKQIMKKGKHERKLASQ